MSAPIYNGGTAFPAHFEDTTDGMTLRDWFAGQALCGMLASPLLGRDIPDDVPFGEVVPEAAYRYADGMLAERAKEAKS